MSIDTTVCVVASAPKNNGAKSLIYVILYTTHCPLPLSFLSHRRLSYDVLRASFANSDSKFLSIWSPFYGMKQGIG